MGGSNSFRVSPEHVQALSKDLQSVVDDITAFITNKSHKMYLPQQATDPVSREAVGAIKVNADEAIKQAGQFVANMQQVVDSLTGAASTYQSNDQNGQSVLQGRS